MELIDVTSAHSSVHGHPVSVVNVAGISCDHTNTLPTVRTNAEIHAESNHTVGLLVARQAGLCDLGLKLHMLGGCAHCTPFIAIEGTGFRGSLPGGGSKLASTLPTRSKQRLRRPARAAPRAPDTDPPWTERRGGVELVGTESPRNSSVPWKAGVGLRTATARSVRRNWGAS